MMASATALATGLALADQDAPESPLHKIMEKVQSNNLIITKGVRTAVAFKKAQKQVVTSAEELLKLAKEAREFKEPSEKQKQPYEKWTALIDDFTKSADDLAKAAGKAGASQAAVKKAHGVVKGKCTACHNVFRVDEEEFK
jgi:cytochrome c556